MPAPGDEGVAPPPAVTYAATFASAPGIEHVAPAPADAQSTPAPVTYHVAPAPAVSHATPVTVNAYVAPAPVTESIAPPQAATCFTLSVNTTNFVKPQFSIHAVEASASQIVGSVPSVDESASPVYNQIHQEQIATEPENVECAQQHTVEELVYVPVPQIQERSQQSTVEQTVEVPLPQGVEGTSKRAVEQIVDGLEDVDANVLGHMQVKRSSEHIAEHTVDHLFPLVDEEKIDDTVQLLEDVLYEKQVQVDRFVQELRRAKERLRLVEKSASMVCP